MFILEESQLLEDTIKNPTVRDLYKTLRLNESSNSRCPFIEVLDTKESILLIDTFLNHCDRNGYTVSNSDNEKFEKLSPAERDEFCKKLNLEIGDVASLSLVMAAALTQLFVIDNFVGPTNANVTEKEYQNLPTNLKALSERIDYKSLAQDGSEVYHRVVNPWTLRLSQLLWTFLGSLGCSRKLLELEFLIWKHRHLTIHLMTLLEPSETFLSDLRKVQDFIFDHHIINDTKENKTQLVRFNIVELCCELIQSALLRDGITSCRKIMEYVSELSGFAIEHTGVLGKRTKFQHNDIPQLVVKVTKKDRDENKSRYGPTEDLNPQELPKDITLDDDTLLPDITFVNEGRHNLIDEQSLDAEAQLLMLTQLDYILKTEVMEESLKDEWTLAYLRSITKSATIWVLKYKALAHRSVVERKHMRKMDRALLQMEELIKTVESNSLEHKRMKSFYSILPLSSWQVQRALGDMSCDLGLLKNALNIFLKIEFWEGIIKCYCVLGQTVKAEKVIRQELEKHETPYLYCLLGDATENIEYYEKSWLLSKGRFARAKKSIGTHYYVRKEYDKAIENYELALSASPSNVSILSLLAYSCLITERYEKAAECYRNLTYIDDTSFLAWNNLSKVYIKLNQKERAWRTLREAIKCNYEEWKIWENFMVVSIEIGALDDVITAWHRIIDIRSSHKDDQILSKLTWALTKRPTDKIDNDYVKLLGEAIKLVARLIATSDCSPRLWICQFKLLVKEFGISMRAEQTGDKKLSKMDIDSRVGKITNALQRATPTSLIADTNWMHEPNKIDRILKSFDELIDCYLYALETMGPRPELWRQWKYTRLTLQNVMKTLENRGYMINTCI